MELEDIIKRCQQGEKEAFRELLAVVEKKALMTAYITCPVLGHFKILIISEIQFSFTLSIMPIGLTTLQ